MALAQQETEQQKLTGLVSGVNSSISIAKLSLTVWAAVLTVALVAMVALVFRRLRRGTRASSAASVVSDAESGASFDATSVISVDISPEEPAAGETNNAYDVEADTRHEYGLDGEASLQAVSGLFEEDDDLAHVHTQAEEDKDDPSLPNFNRAVTVPSHRTFVPDQGSSFL